ncbi:unnamed protein product [Allacma fusca]|uniref:Cuticle protein n=1 Tax=Allacma fusca TaxID=39272 RepID=A0A8J2PQJ3_9HEXA|nr:unnamed protein product [Allacma fusca]
MIGKVATFLAFVAVSQAGVASYGSQVVSGHASPVGLARVTAPVAYATPAIAKTVVSEPFDLHPQYSYGYSVSDALTGDSKSASETRDGDVVKGQYSLVEPDGAIRTVTYTADSINGFNAIVDRSAPAITKIAAAPVVAAAPVARVASPAILSHGIAQQGLVAHRIPPQGYLAHGIAPQRLIAQGIPQQRFIAQGIPQQRLIAQGIPQQRFIAQGIAPQRFITQGVAPQAYLAQGIAPRGHIAHGIPPQGYLAQGIAPQALHAGGLTRLG